MLSTVRLCGLKSFDCTVCSWLILYYGRNDIKNDDNFNIWTFEPFENAPHPNETPIANHNTIVIWVKYLSF